jgi:hypothetical protein
MEEPVVLLDENSREYLRNYFDRVPTLAKQGGAVLKTAIPKAAAGATRL